MTIPPPIFAVEGREFGSRICLVVEQISQQPYHFAAVDLVLDHAQDDMPRCRPLLPGQVHPGQVGPVRQVLDRPGGHAGPRPDQQMGPGLGICAPQGDSRGSPCP